MNPYSVAGVLNHDVQSRTDHADRCKVMRTSRRLRLSFQMSYIDNKRSFNGTCLCDWTLIEAGDQNANVSGILTHDPTDRIH